MMKIHGLANLPAAALALCRSAITCDDGPGREVILYDHDAEPSEELYGLDFAVARKIAGIG